MSYALHIQRTLKNMDEEDSRTSRLVPKCKAVIIGDQSVGKSSIIQRYSKRTFEQKYQATVGIDFISKVITLPNCKQIRLQIWDTAGQERFRSLIPGYLKDCGVAMVVFDLSNHHSYEQIQRWVDAVKESRGNDSLIVLVGNKSDIQERMVGQQEIMGLQQKYGSQVHLVSALTGEGVEELFSFICSQMERQYIQTITSFGAIELIESSANRLLQPRTKGCCSS